MCVQISSFWHTIRHIRLSNHIQALIFLGTFRAVTKLWESNSCTSAASNNATVCPESTRRMWSMASSSSHQWWRMYEKRASISNCTWVMIIFSVFQVIFDDRASHLVDVMHEISDFVECEAGGNSIGTNIWADGPKEVWVYIWRATSTWITSLRVIRFHSRSKCFHSGMLFGPQLAWPLYTMWPAWRPVVVQPRRHGTMPQTEFSEKLQWSTSPTTPAPSRTSNSSKKSNSLKTAYEGLGARMKKRGRVTTPFSDSELSVFLMKDTVGGGYQSLSHMMQMLRYSFTSTGT